MRLATGAQPVHAIPEAIVEELSEGLRRWAPRVPEVDPEKDLATIERLGSGFLIRGDERWPEGLDDLPDAPYELWYQGNIDNGIPAPSKCVALTGSRDTTSYGASVTGDMAYGLAQRGICVISGLAYGIDAHAHRAALAGSQGEGLATFAVLAGGLDRDYPSGNTDLAAAIRGNGLTLSRAPARFRPDPAQVPAEKPHHRRPRRRYLCRGSPLAFRGAEHRTPRRNHCPACRGRPRERKKRQLGRMPPAPERRRGGAGVRCGRTGRTSRRLVPRRWSQRLQESAPEKLRTFRPS